MVNNREASLSVETRLDLLGSSRRRWILTSLKGREQIEFGELVDVIANAETGDGDVTKNDRKTVHVALLQTHLPRLEKRGVVYWDRDRKVITKGGTFDELYRALEGVRPGRDRDEGLAGKLRSVFE